MSQAWPLRRRDRDGQVQHRAATAVALIEVVRLRALVKQAELAEIKGDGGRLDGVLSVDRVGATIRRFTD